MKRLIGPFFAVVFGFSMSQMIACEDEVEDIQSAIDCRQYCDKAAECSDDVDEEECRNECESALDDCQEDELDGVQDQLDQCAENSCDEFVGCTIEAGAECYFGIG